MIFDISCCWSRDRAPAAKAAASDPSKNNTTKLDSRLQTDVGAISIFFLQNWLFSLFERNFKHFVSSFFKAWLADNLSISVCPARVYRKAQDNGIGLNWHRLLCDSLFFPPAWRYRGKKSKFPPPCFSNNFSALPGNCWINFCFIIILWLQKSQRVNYIISWRWLHLDSWFYRPLCWWEKNSSILFRQEIWLWTTFFSISTLHSLLFQSNLAMIMVFANLPRFLS